MMIPTICICLRLFFVIVVFLSFAFTATVAGERIQEETTTKKKVVASKVGRGTMAVLPANATTMAPTVHDHTDTSGAKCRSKLCTIVDYHTSLAFTMLVCSANVTASESCCILFIKFGPIKLNLGCCTTTI